MLLAIELDRDREPISDTRYTGESACFAQSWSVAQAVAAIPTGGPYVRPRARPLEILELHLGRNITATMLRLQASGTGNRPVILQG